MRKMKNISGDKEYLRNLLKSGRQKAIFGLGGFSGSTALSFEIVNHDGYVTEICEESGYCQWTNMNGTEMMSVNINTITI